jgi:pyrrolidone-carboxylate peptidase
MGSGVLVVGFGPFLDITDNPSSRLALAVDGATLPDGQRVSGRVMDVSYDRAPAQTLRFCAELSPALLIGVGVARRRSVVTVETIGRRWTDRQTLDVDGAAPSDLEPGGPPAVPLTAPAALFAEQLGGVVGTDAGRYVCNAWIYRMTRALQGTLPISFIHIPPSGLMPTTLVRALSAWASGEHHGLS